MWWFAPDLCLHQVNDPREIYTLNSCGWRLRAGATTGDDNKRAPPVDEGTAAARFSSIHNKVEQQWQQR